MKPEPLKGKNPLILMCGETKQEWIKKEQVKSAVEWLRKQGQCNCSINYICYSCSIINEAFEDVMEEWI